MVVFEAEPSVLGKGRSLWTESKFGKVRCSAENRIPKREVGKKLLKMPLNLHYCDIVNKTDLNNHAIESEMNNSSSDYFFLFSYSTEPCCLY